MGKAGITHHRETTCHGTTDGARWLGLVGDRAALAERLAHGAAEAGYQAGAAEAVSALTRRQHEVAALIARGLSNAEIAEP